MELFTQRCLIRSFTENDASALHEVLSNDEVMEYIEPPFDLEQTYDFIEEAGLCKPPLVYALVWRATETVIGHIIFHKYEEDSYEIGWIIRRDYWGIGIAGEVTASLIEYAKALNISSCVIECDPNQTASIRLAQKHGFIYEGEDDGCAVYRLML